ncbi:hypothetical protein NW759_013241 [Fusarium solani]|nr:hypothetical protein NW759_013241 [Fusarium solani]
MPWELEHLFTMMVASISPESQIVALRVFQWALMSTAPLRLHQWHHVLAFIKEPVPESLKEWRRSVNYTESDNQLEREIKALSGGLLEVSASRSDEAPLEDEGNLSIRAGAGSLDLEQGETRIVQVIHQSVREFFLEGGGFRLLDASAARNPVGSCHVTIAITCFNYISISELDKLIDARRTYRKQESIFLSEQEPSETGPAQNVDSENESSLAPERNPAQDTTNGRGKTFSEHLSMIPTAETHTIVASWIAAGNIPTNPATEAAPSIQYANSLLSPAYVSRQLEDWPSLLFYVLSSLATHLKAAKTVDEDSPTLFECLDDTELWDRFVLLKEDIPRSTTFSEFMSPRRDLLGDLLRALEARSPRFAIRRRRAGPRSVFQALAARSPRFATRRRRASPRARPAPSSPTHKKRSPSPVSVGRASSVASFASASSY